MSYEMQKRIKEGNRTKISRELKDSPKRFKDLLESTGFSPTGLTKILTELKSEGKIQKILHEGKEAYSLSKKRGHVFDDLFNLSYTINAIRDKGGKHYHDYSQLWGSIITTRHPWGIESDLTIDKSLEKSNPLRREDAEKIEKFVFELIRSNAYDAKIKLDRSKQGKIVFGFEIDYSKLIESIDEYSLEYYNNMEKTEGKFLEKLDAGTITDKEYTKWQSIRQRTLKKIKTGRKN